MGGKDKKKDKKSKEDKKKEKEAKKKLSKEEKKKLKLQKKQKKTESKVQVANFAKAATAAPSADFVNKIKQSEAAQKTAAQGTPAKTAAEEWAAAGKAPGLQIWRIESFAIQPWPKNVGNTTNKNITNLSLFAIFLHCSNMESSTTETVTSC